MLHGLLCSSSSTLLSLTPASAVPTISEDSGCPGQDHGGREARKGTVGAVNETDRTAIHEFNSIASRALHHSVGRIGYAGLDQGMDIDRAIITKKANTSDLNDNLKATTKLKTRNSPHRFSAVTYVSASHISKEH
ncbi:5-hydroxyisourate hydrolase isoform X2 [Stegostoma tigrinum]|uniref:5-hydroxyisourate hydrolase isoform X2 n=1 Tax=Stegostoma tigrinum TaxID=3053191 RepID=UPI00286FCAB2|nr:5-hydroxyisourate hydrolase isoform X2 [Stegostoma tigrinum]